MGFYNLQTTSFLHLAKRDSRIWRKTIMVSAVDIITPTGHIHVDSRTSELSLMSQ